MLFLSIKEQRDALAAKGIRPSIFVKTLKHALIVVASRQHFVAETCNDKNDHAAAQFGGSSAYAVVARRPSFAVLHRRFVRYRYSRMFVQCQLAKAKTQNSKATAAKRTRRFQSLRLLPNPHSPHTNRLLFFVLLQCLFSF